MDMRELFVDPSAFPTRWAIDKELYPIPEMALVEDYHAEEGYLRVLIPEGFKPQDDLWASHMILRYHNRWEAAVAFSLNWPGAFYAYFPDAVSEWKEPEDWDYSSTVADRFRFACVHFKDARGHKTQCTAMAQYDEFISVFEIHLPPNVITLEDVKRILQIIDKRMANYLKK